MVMFLKIILSTGRLCAVRQDTGVVEDLVRILSVNYNILSRERVRRRNNLKVACMSNAAPGGVDLWLHAKTGVNF